MVKKINTYITKRLTKNVEIPYYCKNGGCFIKIDEERIIAVNKYGFLNGIEIVNDTRYNGVIAEADEISEQDFITALKEVFTLLNQLKEVIV